MNDEERADYQQQREEERRYYDESIARWRAAHPLWDRCKKHPERMAVDPSVCHSQFCPECMEVHRDRYTDARIRQDVAGMDDPRNWRADQDLRYYTDHPDYRHYGKEYPK